MQRNGLGSPEYSAGDSVGKNKESKLGTVAESTGNLLHKDQPGVVREAQRNAGKSMLNSQIQDFKSKRWSTVLTAFSKILIFFMTHHQCM